MLLQSVQALEMTATISTPTDSPKKFGRCLQTVLSIDTVGE